MKFYKYILCIAALLSVACTRGTKDADRPRKVKCESVTIDSSNLERATFAGRVVAASDVNIGFRVPGIIEEICLKDGSFVGKGSVVARLDSRDYALQLAATEAEYDAVKAEVDRVVALFADESISANDYDKATNGLRAITAKLEAHRNALSDTELRAPFDGYIHKSNFGRGEAVAAGTPVLTIISASAPEITIDIPAEYYLKERSFESATATIDIYADRTFHLKRKSISPKANANQLYRATFELIGADGTMPITGVSAMVEICYSSDNEANLMIPFSAIVERGGKSSVWVVSPNGKVSSREVEVIEIKSSGAAAIKGDIKEGEVVVVAGVNSLKEGDEVSPLEEPSQSNVGGVK